jgi:CubicO group peptidase (beta-lactamase class C family)
MPFPALEDSHPLLADFASSRENWGVPGAVVGVLRDDQVLVQAAGRTRLPHGAPVTTDTHFLIASISKVWTATLVLQLVDEGVVGLDDPVNRHIDPPLRLGEPYVADHVTVRQLLTHSAGFLSEPTEGDFDGSDAVAKVVASYSSAPQLFTPGRLFSYSNAGYNVLGRLVECRRAKTWDDALHDHLLVPLELEHTVSQVRRAATLPIAIGHEPVSPGARTLRPVPDWCDSRGTGPCGGTVATTAADLLAFARMHIRDGLGPAGRRVLSPAAARLMREPELAVPGVGISWGLGWEITRRDPIVVGHDGSTCGQQSRLTVVPERGLAFCVLTNGDPQGRLTSDVTARLLREHAGIEPPRPPAPGPGARTGDPARLVGRYSYSAEVDIRVSTTGGDLVLTVVTAGDTAAQTPTFTSPLLHAEGDTYLFRYPSLDELQPVTFLWAEGPGGPPTNLALGIRVAVRIA